MKLKQKIMPLLIVLCAFVVGFFVAGTHGACAGVVAGYMMAHWMTVPLILGNPQLGNRLRALGSNPTLRNFAQDASQSSIRKVAGFLAPTVEVPTMNGQYKEYDAKHRYKRPQTRRAPGGRATMIGFEAEDKYYNLAPNALDFPIDQVDRLSDGELLNQAQYGTTLLADAAGLAHEAETIDLALATVGNGTDIAAGNPDTDLIDVLDQYVINVMKAAKNGAPVRMLFGVSALRRAKNHKSVKARFGTGSGKSNPNPGLTDIADMVVGKPQAETAFYVEDTAAEGLDEDIDFLLDEEVIIFACNDRPNTMDPSFMKTFRLMGQWMVPGSYSRDDERVDVLKMDWHEQLKVTNTIAAVRLNFKG